MTAPKTFLMFLTLAFIPLMTVAAQQKYALVIGNGAYANITKLNNPVNDANDMTTTLQSLGFQVDKVLNGTLGQMEDAVMRLKNRLSTNGNAYGFFFYAGHGVQSNGENYLIPVEADIKGESFLRSKALQMQAVLSELNQAENALNIVVLDACRDNPFSWARSASRGLQTVGSQPADSIVVYATSAGTTAADGTGRNGLFTTHLLNNLKTSGLEISEVFRRTGADVTRASNRQQTPAIYSQFFGTAYLGVTPPPPTPPPAPAVTAPQAPRNVRAGTPGTDRVTLNWDSAGSGVSYKVYWSRQNNSSDAKALGNPVSGTSMGINTLVSEKTYYFWVSTVKDDQESEKSSVVTVLIASAVSANLPSDMVLIQGGSFTMGSPESDVDHNNVELQHRVTVGSFYMGKYEVTQKEYQALMGTNPSSFKGDNLPVEQVTWHDAVNYCNARSQSERLTPAYTVSGTNVTWNRQANGYRLPTEAEWEYACRAGTTTSYSSGSSVDGVGWYTNNSGNKTHAVGTKQANEWGLYDMHGNVYEWCWNWYGNDYGTAAQTDPVGASSGTSRVLRGGSWFNIGQYLRSASRNYSTPSGRTNFIGFRLLRPSL